VLSLHYRNRQTTLGGVCGEPAPLVSETGFVRAISKLLLIAAWGVAWTAAPAMVDRDRAVAPAGHDIGRPPIRTVQDDGMSLSAAVEYLRRRADVERVISAETRVSNGREVHHIRVMTRDGKVVTHKVQGRQRN
jgi:hypothetical protein